MNIKIRSVYSSRQIVRLIKPEDPHSIGFRKGTRTLRRQLEAEAAKNIAEFPGWS